LRVDASRLRAAANAAFCAAALALAALGEGCAGGPARQPEALVAQNASPTPAQNVAAVESPLPPPEGFVSDLAEVIDDGTEVALEAKLKQLKARANIEVAVATVETTGGRDIFEYSLAVARGWGIGPPAGEKGGGVLLLLAVKDHKWRIQVSRSLEADITNEVAAEIGNAMTNALRKGQYDEAVTKCVDGLIEKLAERRGFPAKGDAPTVPQEKPKPSPPSKP
jgi:uncharacterized membrane protein YgcG